MKLYISIVCFLLITICSCNPIKKIQKQRDFSNECLEAYEYFRKHLQRSSEGILEFSNYDNESMKLAKVKERLTMQYMSNGACWLNTLHKKDVKKLWGNPHQIIQNKRSNSIEYYYYINIKGCTGLDNLARANIKCGQLSFSFKQDGSPNDKGVFSIFEGHGSLE